MPWNAKSDARKLGPGIPKSDFWASAKEGIDQVGCVYTAQGFEFDYVGVIFGPDLVYRPMDGGWVGQRDQSSDRVVRSGVTEAEFTDFVKSTYRVLLTRGLRGCYVYFMDAPTRDFFLSRIERAVSSGGAANSRPRTNPTAQAEQLPRRVGLVVARAVARVKNDDFDDLWADPAQFEDLPRSAAELAVLRRSLSRARSATSFSPGLGGDRSKARRIDPNRSLRLGPRSISREAVRMVEARVSYCPTALRRCRHAGGPTIDRPRWRSPAGPSEFSAASIGEVTHDPIRVGCRWCGADFARRRVRPFGKRPIEQWLRFHRTVTGAA